MTMPTSVRILMIEAKHRAIMLGYWLRPYDCHLDARRWRWQESGCSRSRLFWGQIQ